MPNVIVIFSIIGIAAALVMLLLGAWTVGETWDEKTHVAFLQAYFDLGWNTDPNAIVEGQPDPRYIWGVYVYGPIGELISHAVSIAFSQEQWGAPVHTALSTSTRHLGTAISAVIGLASVGGIVATVSRSWRWGVLGAAVTASTPLWIGHGMFNIKDTPVAAGYTLATLGIVMVLRSASQRGPTALVVAAFFVVTGTVLAAGTRAASGVPIAAAAILGSLAWWLVMSKPLGVRLALKEAARRAGGLLGLLAAAYMILVVVYPKAFANPFELAWQALVVSARFPFDETVLTSGTWMDQPPPWTYLPLWFGAQLPLLVGIGCLGFLVAWIWQVIRAVTGRETLMERPALAATAVVILQALLLPALAVAGRANMYNGQRQFLFVVPATVALATLGLWVFRQWLAARWPAGSAPSTAFWIVVALGIVVPLISQVRLFPYNYVYYNAAIATQPIAGHWPTDYWRASSNELWRRLPANGPEACAYESFRYNKVKRCIDEGMFQPYESERGRDAVDGALSPGEIWLVRENQGTLTLPDGCRVHDTITRPLFAQDIVIGEILQCTVPPAWTTEEAQ